MRRQYLALLAIFIVLIVLSLWAATQTDLSKIESSITGDNESHQGGEEIIEGQGLLPYVAVTGLLLAVGVGIYWILGKRKAD